MSSGPGRQTKIGEFLLRRLKKAGVQHLFGVPGDYNLELLQQLKDTETLKWIGACSELAASYAADGYARLNGLGAAPVTNGVGALRAINGVASSYSEHVPSICICGSIPLRSIDRSSMMDPFDAPAAVISSSNKGAGLDHGPRSPQHRDNLQLGRARNRLDPAWAMERKDGP